MGTDKNAVACEACFRPCREGPRREDLELRATLRRAVPRMGWKEAHVTGNVVKTHFSVTCSVLSVASVVKRFRLADHRESRCTASSRVRVMVKRRSRQQVWKILMRDGEMVQRMSWPWTCLMRWRMLTIRPREELPM